MKLAPICMSTYVRINHLRQTIEALQKNTLATASEIYIFSDGPKPGDEEKVKTVRKYLKGIKGFKKIEIIESAENAYPDTLRQGMRTLLDKYGRMISFEEDIVTAPTFLTFMNQALDKYENNSKIFSVSGFCPPIKILKDYTYDVFLLPRFSSWGFGIWKDRFDLIKMPLPEDEVLEFLSSWKNISMFGLGGLDMINMVRKDALGKVNALDIKSFYWQYKYNMDTLYPVGSLTKNIGLDGSGLHSHKSKRLKVDLDLNRKSHVLPTEIERNKRIIRANFLLRLHGRTWYRPSKGNLWLIPFLVYHLLHKTDI